MINRDGTMKTWIISIIGLSASFGFTKLGDQVDPCFCYEAYDTCLQGCLGISACSDKCESQYDYCKNSCPEHQWFEPSIGEELAAVL